MREITRITAAALCAVLMPFVNATSAEPEIVEDLIEMLDKSIEDGTVRAAAVGAYDNGERRIVGLGRLASDDARVPAGDTVFEIGSISKVFTALLIQVQVDAGRMTWDDTIERHLPGLQFASDAVASITLRELATHSSGLPRLPPNMPLEDVLDPYAGYDRVRLLDFLTAYDPDQLAKRYDYSNLGAGLLGLLAGDAAKTGYADAMASDVLEPLGMHRTSVGIDERQRARLARGFNGMEDVPNWSGFDALAGAGALLSSIDDLLRFVHLNLEPGALAGALTAIRLPQYSGATGLGWHIHAIDEDDPVFWHNGGTGGYASFLAIRPKLRTGVVVLTASIDFDLVTELGFTQINGVAGTAPSTQDLTPYVGAYRLSDDFVLTVYRHDDELFAQATGQGAFRLRNIGERVFEFLPADIRVTFDAPADGLTKRLELQQGETITPAPRVSDAQSDPVREIVRLDAAVLDDYVGQYALAPGVLITVVRRDEQLHAQLTGQASYPVFAYRADRFLYKVVDARLEFERDESGSVVAVVLHQDGRQRAPRMAGD